MDLVDLLSQCPTAEYVAHNSSTRRVHFPILSDSSQTALSISIETTPSMEWISPLQTCTVCNKNQFSIRPGQTVCRGCHKYCCSKCRSEKTLREFSSNQIQNGDQRKCRACTGQSTATLTCKTCLKALSLSCFKRDCRSPPICNECRAEDILFENESIQAFTGEYVAHGLWDTMTGTDDRSGVYEWKQRVPT